MRALAGLMLAAMLAGCASDQTACEEDVDSTECLAVTAKAAAVAPDGWPPGTPGLVETVLDVRAFDADGAIMGSDRRGLVLLEREETGEAVGLVFDNGMPRRYRLPAGTYRLVGFGERHLCRGADFTIEGGDGADPAIFLTVTGTRDALTVDVRQKRVAVDGPVPPPATATCLTEARWGDTIDKWDTLSTWVVVGGFVVLIPLMALTADSFVIMTGF